LQAERTEEDGRIVTIAMRCGRPRCGARFGQRVPARDPGVRRDDDRRLPDDDAAALLCQPRGTTPSLSPHCSSSRLVL